MTDQTENTGKPDEFQWKKFFDEHAPHYMENNFTRNTVAAVTRHLADACVREMPKEVGAFGGAGSIVHEAGSA